MSEAAAPLGDAPTGNDDLIMAPRPGDPRLARDRRFAARRATAFARPLPHFLIVGGMKCGTGSLFSYLVHCPNMHAPLRKEVHYFTLGRRAGRGTGWYRAHFPTRRRLGRRGRTGEATPDYLFEADALDALAAQVPRAKLIVLLRDPVERALSHYFHEVRMGRERLPLDRAMAREEERLALAHDLGPEGAETARHGAYKARGHYADQLERLFARFPRERILVLGSGTLFRAPAATLARTAAFLGLHLPPKMPDFAVRNRGTNRTPVDPGTRRALERHFAPHNARLVDLLGHAPDW